MAKFLKSKSGIRKTRKIFLIVIAFVIIAAIAIIFTVKGKEKEVSAIVQRGEIKEELVLSGQVEADKHAILYFPTSGKISWVGVKEGETVRRGQALTSLDKTTLNANYQQALNTYRNYQASADNVLDSVQGHADNETFSQRATRTAAEVARDNAYDAVKAAEYNLRNATLTSPFDGVITSLPFSYAGINVMPTNPQVEVVDPKSIYFAVDADQSEVSNLQNGQKVDIDLDSYEKALTGKVYFISYTPKSGEAGTVYRVKVGFENLDPDNALRVGMTGDARFTLSQKSDVLIAPSRFVNSDKEGKYVYLSKDKKKVYVKTGIEGEESIEIIEGVNEGDVLYD